MDDTHGSKDSIDIEMSRDNFLKGIKLLEVLGNSAGLQLSGPVCSFSDTVTEEVSKGRYDEVLKDLSAKYK